MKMGFENPDKIKNIVDGNLENFKKLYYKVLDED